MSETIINPESSASSTGQISIQPRNVFGLRADIKGNINFTIKDEVIYPVAAVLTMHDFELNKQQFLRFPDQVFVEIIAISPNRKLLAIAEKDNGNKNWINIYDLITIRKRKTLNFPNDIPIPEVESLSFTTDSKGLAVLSKEPDAFLIIYYFDKSETVLTTRVSNSNQKNVTAHYLACNPNDTGLVAVAGNYTFKLLSRQERGFTLLGTLSGKNKILTSIVWLTSDILLAGTSDNRLLLIEGGDLKLEYEADTITFIDLSKTKETENNVDEENKKDNNNEQQPPPPQPPQQQQQQQQQQSQQQVLQQTNSQTETDYRNRIDINCLTNFTRGFVFAIHNVLHVFENDVNFQYHKKSIISIEMSLYDEKLYRIENVAINSQMDKVIVTAKHNQIYISTLFAEQNSSVNELQFSTLGQQLHIDGITDMSICLWKPIVMTASKDQTIRVWNYETGQVELVKKYLVTITVIGLHPSGLFVAVGFSDQLKLMAIFLNDLKLIATFNFSKCKQAVFTHKGHMLACAYENCITIVSVFSFEILRNLKGHNGQVLSLVWSQDDYTLVSSGDDGAIYKWNRLNGARIGECVQKGLEYKCLALSNDSSSCYAVSQNGLLREIIGSDVVREISVPEPSSLNTITLSQSDLIMFIGSENGHLYNVQLPFLDSTGGTCTNFRFFQKSVTKTLITPGDLLLITGSDDGTLVIWTILNNEGKTVPVDPELGQCKEIMITRNDLIEKNNTITTLELRIAQQIEEFKYQLSQGNAFHSEQMREIHTGYCTIIEDLKLNNESLEHNHIEEMNILTANITQLKDEHSKLLLDLETEFHSKIIKEFEKSAMVKKKMDEMREDYEVKLRKSASCLQDTSDALNEEFKRQLNERKQLINDLVKEMKHKETEFKKSAAEVDADNEQKLIDLKSSYETRLQHEKEVMLKWRADTGVLNKKYKTLTKLCDELEKEKEILRSEHTRTLRITKGLQKDLEKLHEDIVENERTIRDKEKRIIDLLKRNDELAKYKIVLNYKINDLHGQIEAANRELNEKKNHISQLEMKMEEIEQIITKLELQLTEFKDKYNGLEFELRTERTKVQSSRTQIFNMSSDIYEVSRLVQEPKELQQTVTNLFQKYASEAELKETYLQQLEVEKEFKYQRNFLEKLVAERKAGVPDVEQSRGDKLLNENINLLAELNSLRGTIKEVQMQNSHMESLLGISARYLPLIEARRKLARACTDLDEVEWKHRTECKKLENVIQSLTQENQVLKDKIFKLEK